MWSQILLCLLVGLAAASNSPAWKDNTEYVYNIEGRTLTGLHEIADQYSGVLLKSQLSLIAQGNDLYAIIRDAQYAPVHTQLQGWRSAIPHNKLNYKSLPMTNKPFKIVLENGIITDLIVSKEVPNWEVNIIKSIASQFQINTSGVNLVDDESNTLPTEGENFAQYKTLEDSVAGVYETTYDVKELPQYHIQNQPWLAPKPHLKGDGKFIEVVKSRNFSRSGDRPVYHYGLNGIVHEPAANQMGQFFIKSSVSRSVLSGRFERYTIQNSYTEEEIIMSPTLTHKQKGSVVSMLNVTLQEVKTSQSGQQYKIDSPLTLGGLAYSYNDIEGQVKSRESPVALKASELYHAMHKRSIDNQQVLRRDDDYIPNEKQYLQRQPKLEEAPSAPFLPYSMGYMGKSIKHSEKINVVKSAVKLAQEMGQELQQPNQMPRQDTLAKFNILGSLLRIMDFNDYQKVTQELYTQEQQGPKHNAWVVYRDAAAESGTGPAFLMIKEWIETKKIQHHEAAEVFSVMTKNVRYPTEEYLRAMYGFINKPEILEQYGLNDTALLSFANLVRQVYVNVHESHKQFPVYVYGSFHTESGKLFVENEVIPFFTAQLHKHIANADSHKIHVYIRALGNIGHPKILSAFEPYLEGTKQASEFQRLMMVTALDQLVKVDTRNARNVLYKIYQSNDAQEIRVAAVYQLMRTSPPADMLSQMAAATNTEINHQVNAAVKSSIHTAAELEGQESAYLRAAARSAKPLLTRKEYGIEYSQNHLKSFVSKEVDLMYKHTVQTIADCDSFVPKYVRHTLRTTAGGLKEQQFVSQAMLSSVDELVNVFQRQTEKHEHLVKEALKGMKGEWSSNNVARLLQMTIDQREQLEGNWLLQVGDIERFFSFDNHTVDQLPEIIRKLEEYIKNGNSFKYTKWINHNDAVLSFPTLLGFPFVYSNNLPVVVNVEGQLKAVAQPQIYNNQKLSQPDSIVGESEIRVLISSKLQTQLGFVTPFDHQQYSSGMDRNLQVYVPLRQKFRMDLKTKQAEVEIEPLEPQKTTKLISYSTWPYTTRFNILNLQPASTGEHNQIIRQSEHARQFNQVFGKESTGFAFRLNAYLEKPLDYYWLYQKFQNGDLVSVLLSPLYDELHHTIIDIEHVGELSHNHKVVLRGSLQNKYQVEPQQAKQSDHQFDLVNQMVHSPEKSQARLEEFINIASAGIRHANTSAAHLAVEFQGQKQHQYIFTGAISRSNVDEKSRVLVYLHRQSEQPYFVGFSAKGHFPNTNGLDVLYAMKFNPTSKVKVQFAAGQTFESAVKVETSFQLSKTEERKQYLLNHPMYRVCREEMEQNNHQLRACANMTQEANLLDLVDAKLKYENMDKQVLYKAMDILRYFGYLNIEDVPIKPEHENQLIAQVRFSPNLRYLNCSVYGAHQNVFLKDVRVPDWAKTIFVVHPVFPVLTRLSGRALELETYRPICVADNKRMVTFDNRSYPLTLAEPWTVMMQYVPMEADEHNQQQHGSLEQHLKHQIENFVVLVRNNQRGFPQKDVKLVFNTPETQANQVEIQLVPSGEVSEEYSASRPTAKVSVDGKEVPVNGQQSNDLYKGYVQIYALPNGEVKIELQKAFYIIYDGVRVKITTVNDKLRNAIRGLCGVYDGEIDTEFTTPQNCIVQQPLDFIASYTIVKQGQHQDILERQNKARKPENCIPRWYKKSNVIRPANTRLVEEQADESRSSYVSQAGKIQQTRFVEEDSQICFTLFPVDFCKTGYRSRDAVSTNVPVHCVEQSNVASIWKKQILKGASPDFSAKPATKKIEMQIPTTCALVQ